MGMDPRLPGDRMRNVVREQTNRDRPRGRTVGARIDDAPGWERRDHAEGHRGNGSSAPSTMKRRGEAEPRHPRVVGSPAENFSFESEEKLAPGRPPVVGAGRDLARAGDLHAAAVAVLLDVIR